MFSFLNWFFYYIKCIFNYIISYFSINNKQIIQKNIDNNVNKIKINDYLYIIKLYGSYYEMGKSYGILMNNIMNHDIKKHIIFIKKHSNYFIRNVPKKYIKKDIFESMLFYFNLNYKNYNPDIIDFMKGVSVTSGINLNDLIYVNVFMDLIDNHCILFTKIINNKRIHLRTLDFCSPSFAQTLFCFHPINKKNYISLNYNFIFGVFTGISKNRIFFGESYCDNEIGEKSFLGEPFHHISHKILSDSNNLEDAEKILSNSYRSSNLQLLISNDYNSKIFLSTSDKLILQQEGDLVQSVTPNELEKFRNNYYYLNDINSIINHFIPKTKSGEVHTMIYYDNFVYISITDDIFQSYNNKFYKFNLDDLI